MPTLLTWRSTAAVAAAALGVGGCAALQTPSVVGGKNAASRTLSPDQLREVAIAFEEQGRGEPARMLFAAADRRAGGPSSSVPPAPFEPAPVAPAPPAPVQLAEVQPVSQPAKDSSLRTVAAEQPADEPRANTAHVAEAAAPAGEPHWNVADADPEWRVIAIAPAVNKVVRRVPVPTPAPMEQPAPAAPVAGTASLPDAVPEPAAEPPIESAPGTASLPELNDAPVAPPAGLEELFDAAIPTL